MSQYLLETAPYLVAKIMFGRAHCALAVQPIRRVVRIVSRYHAAMTTKVRRRLTTVLCADVERYARLMEVDEAGTLATPRRSWPWGSLGSPDGDGRL